MIGKKVRKALDKANRENIKKMIVLGENEVTANSYNIKDMDSREEETFSFHLEGNKVTSNIKLR